MGSPLGAGGSGLGPTGGFALVASQTSVSALRCICWTSTPAQTNPFSMSGGEPGLLWFKHVPHQLRQHRLRSGFNQRRNVCPRLCAAHAARVSLPRGCPAPGRGTAAPRAVTSLAQLFPAVLRTRSWGNPNLSILLVFTSKLATECPSDVDNGCMVKLGGPTVSRVGSLPPHDGDAGSDATPAGSGRGGAVGCSPPLSPPTRCPPACSCSDGCQATGAAGAELEHRDCARVSWDQRSRGKETCNKYKAFIQALG